MLSRQAATLSKIPRFLCNTPPLTKMKKRENFPPTSTCVRHVVCVIFSRQSTRWVGRWKNGNGAHRFAQRFVSAGKKRIPKMVKHPEHIIYGLLSQQFYWLFASSESPRWQFRKLSLIVSTLDRCNVQAALVLTECPSKVMKATGRWMWMWMWMWIPPLVHFLHSSHSSHSLPSLQFLWLLQKLRH